MEFFVVLMLGSLFGLILTVIFELPTSVAIALTGIFIGSILFLGLVGVKNAIDSLASQLKNK